MSITFSSDFGDSQQFVGPGHQFTAQSVYAPVPGHTYQMQIDVLRLPNLARVLSIYKPNYQQGTNWDGVFGTRRNADDVVGVAVAGGVFGDDAEVRIEVDDLTAGAVADGPQTFSGLFYDPTCQLYACQLFLLPGAGSGNFTDADRALLQAIDTAVVLPTYTSQVTHVGLTGNGSLNTLAGTRALRVTVTAFPPNVDRATGTPQYFFDLGFFTMNVGQGWVKSQRLVFEFQTYEAPQALDSFGWTLTPGTTINVEELLSSH